MTPLAHAIVVDSALPLKDRRYGDLAKQLGMLDGLHFFECSAVADMAAEMAEKSCAAFLAGHDQLAFLPAPRVLLDIAGNPGFIGRDPKVTRQALLLAERSDGKCDVTWILMGHGRITTTPGVFMVIPLRGSVDRSTVHFSRDAVPGFGPDHASAMASFIYSLLAMINTPRIIGRRVHSPHSGLQRKIAAAHRIPGKYPLQAWHELVLEVTPPRDESGIAPRETRLSGGKALHFVRCHLRIRLGQLELVSAHWRGDEALGLKQTRYRIVPPRKAA